MRRTRQWVGEKGGGGGSDAVNSVDPNQKLGPLGVGNESWAAVGALFNYRIDFENDENASAPAQRVDITDLLQSELSIYRPFPRRIWVWRSAALCKVVVDFYHSSPYIKFH